MEDSQSCCSTGENMVNPGQSQVTIDIMMLPDVALLEIFDFYVARPSNFPIRNRELWITLVHVCRKWREIVFESPRRLNLRLFVTLQKPVRTLLDIWPPLPIEIWSVPHGLLSMGTMGPITMALEHDDRIRQIEVIDNSSFRMEQALGAMQKPFPALIDLTFKCSNPVLTQFIQPVIPDSFLGGSAPRLQSLRLTGLPFPLPGLKKLLLSTTDLLKIRIWGIPNSWYISPEEMVTCLSTLIRLKELELGFQSRDNWGGRVLPPSTRCVLPALTSLRFKGVYEYMEDFMPRIDAPQLDHLKLFLDQPVSDAPQLAQFIGRPRFKALNELHVLFDNRGIFVLLPWKLRKGLQFGFFHDMSNQHSVLVELCTSSSFLRTYIPIVKHLYILESTSARLFYRWLDDVESSQWVDILRPFTTVEDLYLSWKFSAYIGPALCGSVGEGMTEVLPALRNIFLERLPSTGPDEETMRRFVSARRLSGRQIAISYWDGEHDPWFDGGDFF